MYFTDNRDAEKHAFRAALAVPSVMSPVVFPDDIRICEFGGRGTGRGSTCDFPFSILDVWQILMNALWFRSFLLLNLALLGAHFLRIGEPGHMTACMGLGALAFSRRAWVRGVLTMALLAAAATWVGTGSELIRFRTVAGMPWIRLALIMGGLFASSLAGAVLLHGKTGQTAYNRQDHTTCLRTWVFLAVTGILLIARFKAPFPILLADRFPFSISWRLSGWGGLEIFALALYAQWLAARLLDPAEHRRLRPLFWAGFSAVFFLQLALGLAGLERLLMTGNLHLPVPALIAAGPLFRGEGLFMPFLLGISVLLLGPAWCSHLCYIGAWDDQASRLKKKKTGHPPAWLLRLIPWTRPAALLLTCGAALGFRCMGVPGSTAIWYAAGFGLAGLAVMFFVSRRHGHMTHCTAFCPIGWLTNVLGKIAPWRMRLGENCTRCGACAPVCRYAALTPGDIAQGRPGLTCTLCGDCVAACPHTAMHYTLYGHFAPAARSVFIALTVILHTVFLATARM